MDWNEHFVEFLVRERLAQAEAEAARIACLPRRDGRRVRRRLGAALIRLGRWLCEPSDGLHPSTEARCG